MTHAQDSHINFGFCYIIFFFSSRRRHTRCALVTGVQTCALPISIRVATRAHGIDFIPGPAELGDFDPTSTTIALAPGGEPGRLPPDLLHNTYERYWREFRQRETGQREWKDYTTSEWTNVSRFVPLCRCRRHERTGGGGEVWQIGG